MNKALYWRITKSVREDTAFITNHINQNQYEYLETFKTKKLIIHAAVHRSEIIRQSILSTLA